MKHLGVSRPYFWVSVVLPLLILACGAAFLALNWASIPAQIPSNYDFAGRPQEWSGKLSLWGQLGAAAVLYAVLMVVSFFPNTWRVRGVGKRVDPALALRAAGGLLADFRIGVPAVLTFLAVWSSRAEPGPGWVVTPVMLGLLLIPLIRFLLRLYVLRR